MSGWSPLIGVGLRTLLARRRAIMSNSRNWATSASRVQRDQLARLIDMASETEFGRNASFRRILQKSGEHASEHPELVDRYRDAVPILTYDDLLPSLRRMREQGEPDVLWPGVVRDWAQTSGTTAGDKFVPVSKRLMRHNYKSALDVYVHAMRFGLSLPRIFSGKLLFLGGSTDVEVNEHGVRTGDLSGIVTSLIRWPLTRVVLPDKDVALMDHWPSKLDRMARICMNEDIRWVSGMPSWTVALAERMFEFCREQGRPVSTLRELWPNLEVFVHGGVRFTPFEPKFREIWSGSPTGADVPARLEVYPASEGFIAIQDTPGDPGLRLNIDHEIFYEFVPLEEIHDDAPRAFTCDQVEKGQRYVVVMSTCAGLWRYVIGDVVEFDTIPPEGPPRLRIVGRHRLFINAFGENLIVEHIENAVIEAARDLGATTGEFTAAPIYPGDEQGRHPGLEIAIEWSEAIENAGAQVAQFSAIVDDVLKRQNVDYTTKRTDGVGMAPPVVTPLPAGAFNRWLDANGKLGGQHKCPRCANNRDILDEVVGMNKEATPVGS